DQNPDSNANMDDGDPWIKVIEDTRQRTVTFARRRAGLIKKAHELSVLCGVRVGIVMFDTRDASHVYSSSGKPEEIFARYLSKQFHTNESRKRKSVDKDTGTYGFENGSFVRRHLAVVNEYTVGPDGTGSRNLSVKSNKQYHDPNKVSMQAAVSRVDPPVRSTSLSKHKELVQPAQSLNLANNMDPLMLATQDLSSLTFLPENASDPAAINFGCSKDILKLIDENRMCGGSPISNESACGSSTAANSVYDPQLRYYEDCSEQVPKRVKTQTESLFGTNVHSHDQNSSMLDRLLYDPDLANILSNQWQNKHAPNADEHIYSSSTSYGDPEDDDDVDDDDEEVEGYMDLEDDEDDDEDDDGDDDDDDDDDTDSNTVEEEKMSCKDTNNASASDNKPKSSLNRRADETQLSNVTTSSTSSTDT
ncbi:hypothetical protein LPJ73_005693, partial [Coemansia sp. RSA 2703]